MSELHDLSSTQRRNSGTPVEPQVVFTRGPRLDGSRHRPGIDFRRLVDDYRQADPPRGVHLAFLVLSAVVALGPAAQLVSFVLGRPTFAGTPLPPEMPWTVSAYGLLGMVLSAVVAVVVLLEMRIGRAWARTVSVVIAAFALVLTIFGVSRLVDPWASLGASGWLEPFTLLQVAQCLLLSGALVLMHGPGTRLYFTR